MNNNSAQNHQTPALVWNPKVGGSITGTVQPLARSSDPIRIQLANGQTFLIGRELTINRAMSNKMLNVGALVKITYCGKARHQNITGLKPIYDVQAVDNA